VCFHGIFKFLIIFIKTKIGGGAQCSTSVNDEKAAAASTAAPGSTRACARGGGHTGQHNSMK